MGGCSVCWIGWCPKSTRATSRCPSQPRQLRSAAAAPDSSDERAAQPRTGHTQAERAASDEGLRNTERRHERHIPKYAQRVEVAVIADEFGLAQLGHTHARDLDATTGGRDAHERAQVRPADKPLLGDIVATRNLVGDLEVEVWKRGEELAQKYAYLALAPIRLLHVYVQPGDACVVIRQHAHYVLS